MASINGLELKNVKSFNGREGKCFQGNLYLNGKKIGVWSQDGWGGPDEYWFEPELHINEWKFNELVSAKLPPVKYFGHEIPISLDILMEEIVTLKEREKWYKKNRDYIFPIMVVTETVDGKEYWTCHREATNKEINEKERKRISLEKGAGTIEEIIIYRQPEDFNIGEPFKLEDIVA